MEHIHSCHTCLCCLLLYTQQQPQSRSLTHIPDPLHSHCRHHSLIHKVHICRFHIPLHSLSLLVGMQVRSLSINIEIGQKTYRQYMNNFHHHTVKCKEDTHSSHHYPFVNQQNPKHNQGQSLGHQSVQYAVRIKVRTHSRYHYHSHRYKQHICRLSTRQCKGFRHIPLHLLHKHKHNKRLKLFCRNFQMNYHISHKSYLEHTKHN